MHQAYPIAVITQGVGGGGGVGLNFAKNPIQSSTLTSWSKGSPGSFTSTPAWSTTQNLYGGGALLVTFSAGTKTASDYFEGDLNPIQPDQLNQAWRIQFAMWIDTGATFADNDLEIGLWDVTNSVFISAGYVPVNTKNNLFIVSFQIYPSLSTNYKLRIRSTVGSTTCVGNFRMGDLMISPWNGIMAPAVGKISMPDVTAYTAFSWANLGCEYWRIGRKLVGRVRFRTSGSPPVTEAGLVLPSNLSALIKDTGSTYSYVVGQWWRGTNGVSQNKRGVLSCHAGVPTTIKFGFDDFSTGSAPINNSSTGVNWSQISTGSEEINCLFEIEISSWADNIQISGESVEYLFNTSTSTSTNDTTNFGYGQEGAQIQNITTSLNRRVHSRYPIGPTDIIEVQWSFDRVKWSNIRSSNGFVNITPGTYQNPYFFGIGYLNFGIGGTDIDITFGHYADANNTTYGGVGSTWATGAGSAYWRIAIYRGGRNAEIPPLVRAEYTNTDSAAINVAINFNTKAEDTHNAVTTGAGSWKFTAPVSGLYLLIGNVFNTALHNYYIFKGGVSFKLFGETIVSSQRSKMITTVRLTAGEYIDIRDVSGANVGDTPSRIEIERIGN